MIVASECFRTNVTPNNFQFYGILQLSGDCLDGQKNSSRLMSGVMSPNSSSLKITVVCLYGLLYQADVEICNNPPTLVEWCVTHKLEKTMHFDCCHFKYPWFCLSDLCTRGILESTVRIILRKLPLVINTMTGSFLCMWEIWQHF